MLASIAPASSSGCPWTARTSSPKANISTGAVAEEPSNVAPFGRDTTQSPCACSTASRAGAAPPFFFSLRPVFLSAVGGNAASAAANAGRSVNDSVNTTVSRFNTKGKPHVLGATVPPSASAMTWHPKHAPYTLTPPCTTVFAMNRFKAPIHGCAWSSRVE